MYTVSFAVVTTIITENNKMMTAEIQQLKMQKNCLIDKIENIKRVWNKLSVTQCCVDAYCPKRENSESRGNISAICFKQITTEKISH